MKNIMQETVCPHFNSTLCNILAFNSALFVQLFHKNKDTNTIFIKQKQSIMKKQQTNPRSGVTGDLAAYIFIAHIHTVDTSTYHETMTLNFMYYNNKLVEKRKYMYLHADNRRLGIYVLYPNMHKFFYMHMYQSHLISFFAFVFNCIIRTSELVEKWLHLKFTKNIPYKFHYLHNHMHP